MKQILNNNNGLLWISFLFVIFSCLMLFWLYQNFYENHRIGKIGQIIQNSVLEKTLMLNSFVENSPVQNYELNGNADKKLGCQLPKNISIDTAIYIPFKQWLTSFKAEALGNDISNETIRLAFKMCTSYSKSN